MSTDDTERLIELEKDVVRLTVAQESIAHRIEAVEAAIVSHLAQEERMTLKISDQLSKLNNAVIVIVVTMFLTLGKELPWLVGAIF